MGEHISVLDALVVTLVSMVAVFIVLVLISFLINRLKAINNEEKLETNSIVETEEKKEILPEAEEKISEELVAVIAAAIASSLGLNIPDIKIKTIKRVPQSTNLWAATGRKEQVSGRLY